MSRVILGLATLLSFASVLPALAEELVFHCDVIGEENKKVNTTTVTIDLVNKRMKDDYPDDASDNEWFPIHIKGDKVDDGEDGVYSFNVKTGKGSMMVLDGVLDYRCSR